MCLRLLSCAVSACIFVAAILCAAAQAQTLDGEHAISITTESLPSFATQERVSVTLMALGGEGTRQWKVTQGALPDGLILSETEGTITGAARQAGDYAFTVTVIDSGKPSHAASRDFKLRIVAALLLEWLKPPMARDNRIDGSVKVSNGSKDDFDLTVIVVGVASNGRATALGYERFSLKAGTTQEIVFGNTLPAGGYGVHVDAVAEVASKNVIFRQSLQTANPLSITQGP